MPDGSDVAVGGCCGIGGVVDDRGVVQKATVVLMPVKVSILMMVRCRCRRDVLCRV